MVTKPLIRPYFSGGWHWGAPLGSHEFWNIQGSMGFVKGAADWTTSTTLTESDVWEGWNWQTNLIKVDFNLFGLDWFWNRGFPSLAEVGRRAAGAQAAPQTESCSQQVCAKGGWVGLSRGRAWFDGSPSRCGILRLAIYHCRFCSPSLSFLRRTALCMFIFLNSSAVSTRSQHAQEIGPDPFIINLMMAT